MWLCVSPSSTGKITSPSNFKKKNRSCPSEVLNKQTLLVWAWHLQMAKLIYRSEDLKN